MLSPGASVEANYGHKKFKYPIENHINISIINFQNELKNQQQQWQDTFYGKFLNNDEIDNLLRQLADLYDEDTIELCRKESLSTYAQIAKFLTQTFYNDDLLEEYEIILLFIRLQQVTIYGKMLKNDEGNNLLEQLADLYDEDSIEEKLNKAWKEAIDLCRKESLATCEQISKFLIQAFYNDDLLEKYELLLLLIRLQVFENLNFIYEEKINEIFNYSNVAPYNKIGKYKESVEYFNRLPKD
ncbi:34227_t:CDS:2 [Gigaspora margarita]|uniref:34227_t:CDS:1 n=1 Tax=Gigaspora margarita TaxID=4874 RepID=A0ABN7URC2_GIGMA|nr:34227_t:CDS:2 [Gigaspora margarita]